MPNLVAQVKHAITDSDTAIVADLYDDKFCTRLETCSLLHFDDPDDPFKDECGNIWTPGTHSDNIETADTDVSIITSNPKFGSGCLYFITKNSRRNISFQRYFRYGGCDFTIDLWMRGCMTFYSSSKNQLVQIFMKGSNQSDLTYKKTSSATVAQKIYGSMTNTWQHFALCYNYASNVLTAYLNGVKKGAYTPGVKFERDDYSTKFVVYQGYTNTSYPPCADELRIVDGVQVWTSNFTPPNEPYKLVDGHIPCRLQGSTQRLWAPFNFIKTDLTPAEDTDTTVADSDTT